MFARRALSVVLGLGWSLAVPAMLTLCFYEHVLARTPSAWFGATDSEAQRRMLITVVVFVLLASLVVYWRSARRQPATLSARHFAMGLGAALAITGALSLAVSRLLPFGESYRVRGLGMLPTLKTGDELRVVPRRFSAMKPPLRGELVQFESPQRVNPSENVLRVIGLQGDRVEVRAGFVAINGWQVPTCDVGRYFRWGSDGETNARMILEFLDDRVYLTVHEPLGPGYPEFLVPVGEVFVLGDNRSQARDSRTWRGEQPSGLPLSAIRGSVDRLLLSKLSADQVDTTATGKPPEFLFNLPGQDVVELEQGIKACLKDRPALTHPPRVESLVPPASVSAASL